MNCEQNVVKFGKKCIEKCNFYIKYFDKIKCYADRPYLVLSELKPETHIYFFGPTKQEHGPFVPIIPVLIIVVRTLSALSHLPVHLTELKTKATFAPFTHLHNSEPNFKVSYIVTEPGHSKTYKMSHITRKPVFRVCDQVRLNWPAQLSRLARGLRFYI